jgi:hypothetical protein
MQRNASLCHVFSKCAWHENLREMLDKISNMMVNTSGLNKDNKIVKQTVEYTSRMIRKQLFFNPGLPSDYWENDEMIRKNQIKTNGLQIENKFGKQLINRFAKDIIASGHQHVLQKLIVHAEQNKFHILSKGPPDTDTFIQSICPIEIKRPNEHLFFTAFLAKVARTNLFSFPVCKNIPQSIPRIMNSAKLNHYLIVILISCSRSSQSLDYIRMRFHTTCYMVVRMEGREAQTTSTVDENLDYFAMVIHDFEDVDTVNVLTCSANCKSAPGEIVKMFGHSYENKKHFSEPTTFSF